MENKNIYIELGSNNGETTVPVLQNPQYDQVFGFEPNPAHDKILNDLTDTYKHFTYINKAVWIHNGTVTLILGRKRNQQDCHRSSSMFDKKFLGRESIEVKCIDFSEWLNDFKEGYNIELQMDIEGAEYGVLDKMLKGDTIKLINKLTIEFHHKKMFDQKYREIHRKLFKRLKKTCKESKIELFAQHYE